jgi:hypothetical protein
VLDRHRNATLVASFEDRGFAWPAAGASLLRVLKRRPHDAVACAVAVFAAGAVMLNALWLQAAPHPAPLFPAKARPVAVAETTGSLVPAAPPPTREVEPHKVEAAPLPATKAVVPAQPAPPAAKQARHDKAHAASLSKRVLAVQRALADFGYGQMSPTGVLDAATKSAIERFERERKLPITGQASDRLMRELAAVTGRPLE